MRFFSRLFNQPNKDGTASSLPVNWKQTLHECNFFKARRSINDFFHRRNKEAEAKGGHYIWKKEIDDAWKEFSLNPCYETAVRLVTTSPRMFLFFDSQYSFHRPAIWTATTFRFENYGLPFKTTDIKELRELSQQEYTFFPRFFKGEIIYHVTPIRFLCREWELMVSAVQGKIYKWAASLEVKRDEDYNSIGNEVIEYCIAWLGEPTEEKLGYFFWNTPDGNVILQLKNMVDWYDISIFITSGEISKLEKLPFSTGDKPDQKIKELTVDEAAEALYTIMSKDFNASWLTQLSKIPGIDLVRAEDELLLVDFSAIYFSLKFTRSPGWTNKGMLVFEKFFNLFLNWLGNVFESKNAGTRDDAFKILDSRLKAYAECIESGSEDPDEILRSIGEMFVNYAFINDPDGIAIRVGVESFNHRIVSLYDLFDSYKLK